MNIQNWNKSAYVTIGNPPFFRLEGCRPSESWKVSRLAFGFPADIITTCDRFRNLKFSTFLFLLLCPYGAIPAVALMLRLNRRRCFFDCVKRYRRPLEFLDIFGFSVFADIMHNLL